MKKIIKLSAVMLALAAAQQGYAKEAARSLDETLGASSGWARWLPDSMNRFDVAAIYGMLSNNTPNLPYADAYQANTNVSSGVATFFPSVANSWAGFRLGAGFNLNNKTNQYLDVQYLYFNNSASNLLQADQLNLRLNALPQNLTFENSTAYTQTFQQYQTLQFNLMPKLAVSEAGDTDYGFYYGIKGAYIKSGYNADIDGGQTIGSATYSARDTVFMSNELFGMGPQIGETFQWAINSWLDFNGNAFLGLLFGNDRARYNETFYQYDNANTAYTDPNYSNKQTNSNWAAFTLGGQVSLAAHKLDRNGNVMSIEGGLGGDYYTSSPAGASFSIINTGSGTTGSPSMSNNYVFRNVFIRLGYKADGVRSMDK